MLEKITLISTIKIREQQEEIKSNYQLKLIK